MSKLMDIMTAPWAVVPNTLCEIRDVYTTHLRGEKIDISAVEARLGRPLNNEQPDVLVQDGVAIVTANGVVAKRMNMFSRISGGMSTEILAQQLEAAMADHTVRAIILSIDSPGGTVDGTFELAQKIYDMRGTKPIVTFVDGLSASAAYAISAATDAIYISGPTAHVGSIGVVATHVDYSGAEEKYGVKTTEIYAGKYKRIASSYAPLTAEGKQSIQDSVDYLYGVFVDSVAKFRGVSVDTVLEKMADGKVFIGQQAIDAGLVDGVSTLEEMVSSLAKGQLPPRAPAASVATTDAAEPVATVHAVAAVSETKHEETNMTLDEIKAKYPEHVAALHAEGVAEGHVDGLTKGATAERERIQAVLAQSMPGHEKLVNQLAFDGKTTGPEAAVQVLAAEKAVGKATLENLHADAPAAVQHAAATDTATAQTPEEKAKTKWDADTNLQAEFGGKFSRYLAYENAIAAGTVRISGQKRVA